MHDVLRGNLDVARTSPLVDLGDLGYIRRALDDPNQVWDLWQETRAMRVNDLGSVEHPDFNNVVIQFTGRRGVERRVPEVEENDDLGRLQSIVEGRRIIGSTAPASSSRLPCA